MNFPGWVSHRGSSYGSRRWRSWPRRDWAGRVWQPGEPGSPSRTPTRRRKRRKIIYRLSKRSRPRTRSLSFFQRPTRFPTTIGRRKKNHPLTEVRRRSDLAIADLHSPPTTPYLVSSQTRYSCLKKMFQRSSRRVFSTRAYSVRRWPTASIVSSSRSLTSTIPTGRDKSHWLCSTSWISVSRYTTTRRHPRCSRWNILISVFSFVFCNYFLDTNNNACSTFKALTVAE